MILGPARRLLLRLEDVVLDEPGAALRQIDFAEQRVAPVLDLAEALLEGVDAAADEPQMVGALALRTLAPEQSGAAELTQLLEPAAHVLQQQVPLSLAGERVQLAVHGAQLLHQPIQLLASLGELCAQRVFVEGCDRFHWIP